MRKIFVHINHVLSQVMIFIINIYQYTLSPDKGLLSFRLKGKVCHHEPHCSEYGKKVFERYGFFKGLFLSVDRVLHCRGAMTTIYDPEFYKVVFFSSAPIGVPFLQELAKDNRYELVGVVTQGDKASGRGLEVHPNIIKSTAQELIQSQQKDFIMTPNKLNPSKSEEGQQFAERLKSKNPDFIVVIAYGKIISQSILDIPTIAPINVHGSLLPFYRGASPLQSIFLNDDKETGLTIMRMDATMDTGNMITKLKFKIPFDRTVENLINKIKEVGPTFLTDSLWKYAKNYLGEIVQNHDESSYCYKIDKESGEIDIHNLSLTDIYNKYRAFYMRPKIYFFHNGKRCIIEKIVLDEILFGSHKEGYLFDKDYVLNPSIQSLVVKPEGKKSMSWEDFVRGYIK